MLRLPTLTATRDLTPLHEGSSLPAVIEAEDGELYVMKFAGAGPLARISQTERFHWLTHPRSTTIQVSPVHSGVCDDDPQAALDDLFARLVA